MQKKHKLCARVLLLVVGRRREQDHGQKDRSTGRSTGFCLYARPADESIGIWRTVLCLEMSLALVRFMLGFLSRTQQHHNRGRWQRVPEYQQAATEGSKSPTPGVLVLSLCSTLRMRFTKAQKNEPSRKRHLQQQWHPPPHSEIVHVYPRLKCQIYGPQDRKNVPL